MFFVGMMIGIVIGGSIGGFVVALACFALNADLHDQIDILRGGADAQ